MNFLHLAVFKILQFKINHFPFSSCSAANLPALWQKINFWEVGLSLLEKQLIYGSDPLLCFDNNTAESIY